MQRWKSSSSSPFLYPQPQTYSWDIKFQKGRPQVVCLTATQTAVTALSDLQLRVTGGQAIKQYH